MVWLGIDVGQVPIFGASVHLNSPMMLVETFDMPNSLQLFGNSLQTRHKFWGTGDSNIIAASMLHSVIAPKKRWTRQWGKGKQARTSRGQGPEQGVKRDNRQTSRTHRPGKSRTRW